MARINRSDVIQKAVSELAISISEDKIPNETLDKVQLTFGLNRQFSNFIVASGSSTTGAFNLVLPTTSPGSETYITAVNLGLIKDAACDVATGGITLTIPPDNTGQSVGIIAVPVLTLTAQNDNITMSLPYPLKVKNTSTCTVGGTYSLGTMRRNASIVGFTTSSN